MESQLLDCTIRDGGYTNNWDFSDDQVRECYRAVHQAGYSYMEIGFRDNLVVYRDHLVSKWKRCTDALIEKTIGDIYVPDTKIAIMVNFGNSQISDFHPKNDSLVTLVRIAVHKHQVFEGCDYAAQIKQLGYEVSINAMGTMVYTDEELERLAEKITELGIDYLYIADSYGSMFGGDFDRVVTKLNSCKNGFKIGFHAHHNLHRGVSNGLKAIDAGVDLIDSTMYGMGRGAGNLPTELFVAELCHRYPDEFDLDVRLLPCLRYICRFLCPKQLEVDRDIPWGYTIPYLITGVFACHVNYAMKMLEYEITDIDTIWKTVKAIVQHRKNNVFDRKFLEDLLAYEAGPLE